jgi:hypothetical protein
MIGGVLDAIRTHVLAPQTAAPTPAEERVYPDPQRAPLKVQRATGQVVGLTSTPMNPQIGSGFGGVAGGTMTLRHIAALVLTVQGANRSNPEALRDTITTSLVRRALEVDWVNVYVAADQTIDKVGVTIEYADLEEGNLAAYATVVFTIDTEWTV